MALWELPEDSVHVKGTLESLRDRKISLKFSLCQRVILWPPNLGDLFSETLRIRKLR